MKFGLILFSIFASTHVMAVEYSCKGIHRDFTADKTLSESSVELKTTHSGAGSLRLENEINDRTFVVSVDLHQSSALLSIVQGPDYTNGINSRAGFAGNYASTAEIKQKMTYEAVMGEDGQMKVKETPTGVYTLYKIECYAR